MPGEAVHFEPVGQAFQPRPGAAPSDPGRRGLQPGRLMPQPSGWGRPYARPVGAHACPPWRGCAPVRRRGGPPASPVTLSVAEGGLAPRRGLPFVQSAQTLLLPTGGRAPGALPGVMPGAPRWDGSGGRRVSSRSATNPRARLSRDRATRFCRMVDNSRRPQDRFRIDYIVWVYGIRRGARDSEGNRTRLLQQLLARIRQLHRTRRTADPPRGYP